MSTGQVLSHPLVRGTANNPADLQPADSQADPSLASARRRRAAPAMFAHWRAWWRGATGRATGRVPGTPALWYRTFRRWSPGIVPPLLGTLLLLAAGVIATHSTGQQPALVDPHTLLALFIVYLVIGTTYGVLLYLASSTTVWWTVLLAGIAI